MRFDWNDENTAMAAAMWREGHSGSAIAKELGVSRSAVMGRLSRMGQLKRSDRVTLAAMKEKTCTPDQ